MKPFKTFFFTLAVIFSFTACEHPTIEDGTYIGHFHVDNYESHGYFHLWNIQVLVESNKNKTMNFTIKEVKFNEEMSAIDIKITGIIIKKTKEGFTLLLPKEGIIPADMTGTPLPQYTIKELNGTITAEHLSFSMFCNEYVVWFNSGNIC